MVTGMAMVLSSMVTGMAMPDHLDANRAHRGASGAVTDVEAGQRPRVRHDDRT